MYNNMQKLSLQLCISAILVIGVIWEYFYGKLNYFLVIGAIMCSIFTAYNLLSLKFDGILAFMNEENSDERMREIWNKAHSNGYKVLFFCTWFSALLIHDGRYNYLLPKMGLYLASISCLSFLIVFATVIWLKYKVYFNR